MNLSILIPAHNEERNIEETLWGVLSHVTVPDYEIIVVADHCTDRTEEIVMRVAADDARVRLLTNPTPRGFGNALICGFRSATGSAVVPIMADDCDDPSTINHMWEILTNQSIDVVCASRYMKGGAKKGGPFIQDKLSRIVCRSLRILTRVPTRDCVNSFKMYRRSCLCSLPYAIAGAGTEYSMALLFLAYFAGHRIIDVPTTWIGTSIPLFQEFKIFQRFKRYWHWYVRVIERTFSLNLSHRNPPEPEGDPRVSSSVHDSRAR